MQISWYLATLRHPRLGFFISAFLTSAFLHRKTYTFSRSTRLFTRTLIRVEPKTKKTRLEDGEKGEYRYFYFYFPVSNNENIFVQFITSFLQPYDILSKHAADKYLQSRIESLIRIRQRFCHKLY